MPIAQERMIALINAALDYQIAFTRIQREIIFALNHSRNGQWSSAQALDHISTYAEAQYVLKDPTVSPAIIMTERRHFARNWARNQASAARLEQQRRLDGIPRSKRAGDRLFIDSNTDSDDPSVNSYRTRPPDSARPLAALQVDIPSQEHLAYQHGAKLPRDHTLLQGHPLAPKRDQYGNLILTADEQSRLDGDPEVLSSFVLSDRDKSLIDSLVASQDDESEAARIEGAGKAAQIVAEAKATPRYDGDPKASASTSSASSASATKPRNNHNQ